MAAETISRVATPRLSFKKFNEFDGEIFNIGDSTTGAYTGFTHSCEWIYTLAESRTRPGIYSNAVPGDSIEGQMSKFDAAYTGGARPKAVWVGPIGVNNLNGGDSVATTTTKYQALVDDVRTKLPSARLYLVPVLPCKNAGCNVANVQAYNANIAGTGGTPITCSGSCVRVDYASTWGTTLDDGTFALTAACDSGDGIHEKDPCRKIIGQTERAQLLAHGDLN
jgi:hypothetical protein